MEPSPLPLIDEHAIVIDADADTVWAALIETLDRTSGHRTAAWYARAVGCQDVRAGGPRPLAAGSAVTGFHVASAERPRLLALAGHHRFSTYALTFRLDALGPASTRLVAETRASFPGLGGRLYRAAVIGTRGHRFAIRRLLGGIRERTVSRRPRRSPRPARTAGSA